MTLTLIRRGEPTAPLVISYYLDPSHIRGHIPESWSLLYSGDTTYTHRTMAEIEGARRTTGARGPLVLIGYSAGCLSVRQLLLCGVQPEAVIALDGTANEWPPTEAKTRPWREAAKRAETGNHLCVITATENVYTEKLRDKPFASTLRIASAVWLGEVAKKTSRLCTPGVFVRGCFRIEVHESGTCDGDAHKREASEHGPRILRNVLVPWIEARGDRAPDTQPAPCAHPHDGLSPLSGGQWECAACGAFLSDEAAEAILAPHRNAQVPPVAWDDPAPDRIPLGLRVLARAKSHDGIREERPNRGTEVDRFNAAFGLVGQPWCASAASACLREACAEAGAPLPFELSARVANLIRNAKARGRFHEMSAAEVPGRGDLMFFGRGGQDPRRGGNGHVAIVDWWSSDRKAVYSGNDEDGFRRREWGAGEESPWGAPVGWAKVG